MNRKLSYYKRKADRIVLHQDVWPSRCGFVSRDGFRGPVVTSYGKQRRVYNLDYYDR